VRGFRQELVEFNGEGDHVHLLVEYPPRVAPSQAGQFSQGRLVADAPKERKDVARIYCKGVHWSASYFAGSVGGAPLFVLKQYIENQRAPDH
jgi:putative transposase